MAVNLSDIAKALGVSTMTVSRALNNPNKVKKSTLDKINKAIEDHGYCPNLFARRLASGKSKTIGLIASNLSNIAYLSIVSNIEKAVQKEGFTLLKVNVDTKEDAVNALNNLVGSQVMGIILLPLEMRINEVSDYKEAMRETGEFLGVFKATCMSRDIKMVTVSQKIDGVPDVAFDFVLQAEKSVEYLIQNGYRDIVMINSVFDDGLWKEKEETYIAVMKKHGLDKYIKVVRDMALVEGGVSATESLLKDGVPQAIYCANDYMAAGALQALYKKGITVPEKVAVMGNDDMEICKYLSPTLSTVSLGFGESGEIAVKKLFSILSGQNERDFTVSPILIERESTAKKN